MQVASRRLCQWHKTVENTSLLSRIRHTAGKAFRINGLELSDNAENSTPSKTLQNGPESTQALGHAWVLAEGRSTVLGDSRRSI